MYAAEEVLLEVEVDIIAVLLDRAQDFQRFCCDLGVSLVYATWEAACSASPLLQDRSGRLEGWLSAFATVDEASDGPAKTTMLYEGILNVNVSECCSCASINLV